MEVTKLPRAIEEGTGTAGDERLELTVGKVTVRLPHAFAEQTLARVLQVLEERT